ncbi:50S ribosomal protein L44e [Nanoarchaeota archaeon]
MKLPKIMKRLCPYCKKHTEHKVTESKRRTAGSAHPLARYAKKRSGYGKGSGNLGRYGSRPPIAKFKQTGKKQSKKVDLRYQCTVCKKMHVQKKGIRAKKFELK